MTEEQKYEIATSFSGLFESADLNIQLSRFEYDKLKQGLFANDMNDCWHVFILDEHIFLSRSWSEGCIFKVDTEITNGRIQLNRLSVTRDSEHYQWTDIDKDVILFKQVLQSYLNREDIYVDQRMNIQLIKETIQKNDPNNEYKKTIGNQNVQIVIRHLESVVESGSKDILIEGLQELKKNTSNLEDGYETISLHLSFKKDRKNSITFYFDKEGQILLGRTSINHTENV